MCSTTSYSLASSSAACKSHTMMHRRNVLVACLENIGGWVTSACSYATSGAMWALVSVHKVETRHIWLKLWAAFQSHERCKGVMRTRCEATKSEWATNFELWDAISLSTKRQCLEKACNNINVIITLYDVRRPTILMCNLAAILLLFAKIKMKCEQSFNWLTW